VKVPIKDIAVINRQRKLMKAIPELASSIKEVGRLIHPVNLRHPSDEDKAHPDYKGEPWILVTGGRRLAAHIYLGWDEIEYRDWGSMTPVEREIVELRENLDREAITWQEEVEAKERIHQLRQQQSPDHTAKDTADELGEHKSSTSRDLHLAALMKADPTLKKAGSKKSALRAASFKAEIDKRVAAVSTADITDLRSKLVTADMRDYVRLIPDQSVDLVFTDFPFAIDYDSAGNSRVGDYKSTYRDDPSNIMDLIVDVVPHIVRIVKPKGWIACMMGDTHSAWLRDLFRDACGTHASYREVIYLGEKGTRFDPSKVIKMPHCTDSKTDCRFLEPELVDWIWYRANSRMPSLWPEKHANNQYEKFVMVNGGEVPNVLAIENVYSDRIHEMQRPYQLCAEVITRLTLTGEKVVDLCFGSGSALAAAADLGRDFAGCDINPDNLGPALGLVAQYYKKKMGVHNV
jgi:ParB-like chromosome segregation protein Spo0J/DNA modification methylase